MELAEMSSGEMAKATGMSGGYVRQVRLGKRCRVRREFLLRAGNELGRRFGEPGRLATALTARIETTGR